MSEKEYVGTLVFDYGTAIPSIDMGQPIVRYRDCAYYDDEPDLTSSTPKCWRDPEHRGAVIWTRPDGFCAWGERKAGE